MHGHRDRSRSLQTKRERLDHCTKSYLGVPGIVCVVKNIGACIVLGDVHSQKQAIDDRGTIASSAVTKETIEDFSA